jgi:protease I
MEEQFPEGESTRQAAGGLDRVNPLAAGVLRRNGIKSWTKPAPTLYPHQWSWDSAFIALGLAHIDNRRARDELESLFAGQWATGKVPHIVFNPEAPPKSYFPDAERWNSSALSADAPSGSHTSGLCQPPVHAIAVRRIWETSRGKEEERVERARRFLKANYPRLFAWHRYLATEDRARGVRRGRGHRDGQLAGGRHRRDGEAGLVSLRVPAGHGPLRLSDRKKKVMANDLRGRKIAILATDGVERVELEELRGALRGAGADTELLSIHPGEIQARQWDLDLAGSFPVDRLVSEASVDDYDGLLLPGGTVNPDQLRTNPDAVGFVKEFVGTGKPVAAICHGPWTLVEADVVRGRRITSWPSLRTDLRNAGAEVVDQEVVIDEQFVTSRSPDDLPAFCPAIVEQFAQAGQSVRSG